MRAFALAVPLALGALACGPTPKAEAPASGAKAASEPAKPKFDFQALVKREAGLLKPFRVEAPDGSWSATISAVSAPKVTVQEGKGYSVAVDIGSERPVDCAVWTTRIDLATTLQKLVVAPIARHPIKEVAAIDARADDGFPNVTLDMFAVNDRKEGNHVKATLVALTQWTVGCVHDELGYAETVRSAALELGRTLAPASPPIVARYHDIAIARIGDVAVGFAERFVFDEKSGNGTIEIEYDSFIVPKTTGEISFGDTAFVSENDAAGLVRSASANSGDPSGLLRSLKLERKGDREYAVDGNEVGKEVHGTFRSKRPLKGSRARADVLAANARGGGRTAVMDERWAPARNPLGATVYTYTPVPGFDAAAPSYVMDDGRTKSTVVLDRKGIETKLTEPAGPQLLTVSRVFTRGAL